MAKKQSALDRVSKRMGRKVDDKAYQGSSKKTAPETGVITNTVTGPTFTDDLKTIGRAMSRKRPTARQAAQGRYKRK